MAPRLALCLEQTLGHRAYSANLEAAAHEAEPIVHHIRYPERARMRAPWALRGSLAAARALRSTKAYDVAMFHTQTIALFARVAAGGARYVVGVDATPRQMDEMGAWYVHRTAARPIEAAKRAWYRHAFGGADAIVSWSEWAARSLVEDYGVEPSRIVVAHPGAGPEFFGIPRAERRGPPTILFVGGDFERKGGPSLLRAFERLQGRARLVLVTDHPIQPRAGMTVLPGVRPGTPELWAAYEAADVFCLPTLGDCTSVAIGEAMAAGLPVVTSSVGSNPEWVADGVTGILHAAGDDEALFAALSRLTEDHAERQLMGEAARAFAHEHMDASANARRVIQLLQEVAA